MTTTAIQEPACWSWAVPPFPTVESLLIEQESRPPDERRTAAAIRFILSMPSGAEGERFVAFHADRCAICGTTERADVEDHDHATGQVRGYLCPSCNVLEGASSHPTIEMYRRRHPAAILDYHAMYNGRGWRNGWSLVEHRAGAYEGGPRPPTPWPTWAGDDSGR